MPQMNQKKWKKWKMIINQNRYATGGLEVVEKNHENAKGRI